MTVNPEWPATTAHLHSLVHELHMTMGAQIAVALDGHCVLDTVVGDDGRGKAIRPDTLLAVYCTTKPLLALAIAVAERRGQLRAEQQLGSFLELPDHLSRITLAQVLSHTAGLDGISGLAINLIPEPDWLTWSVNTATGASASGDRAAYSEFAGWHLLSLALGRATGRPWQDLIVEDVLRPLGVEDVFLPIAPGQFEGLYDRLGLNVDLRHEPPIPMLVERAERIATHGNAAFGGYATARGLESFYRRLLGVLGGEQAGDIDAALLRRTLQPLRPRMHDSVLGTACRFGYGWMLDLSDFRFGKHCSPTSFGHAGNVGMSFAFADPDLGLSVGVVFNGLLDVGESLDWRRGRLVDALYEDLRPRKAHTMNRRSATEVPRLLHATGVGKAYRKRHALREIDLTVLDGELIALLGPNGAGKSTLFDLVTGLRKPTEGKVTMFDETAPSRMRRRHRQRIGVMLQHADLEHMAKVGELLRRVARQYPSPHNPAELMERLGLREFERAPIGALSAGIRRRVELACALVGRPDLLLLDEPTSGVDPESRQTIWRTIHEEHHRGVAVVLSTHMVEEITVCSRVVVLVSGRIVVDGPPDVVLASPTAVVSFRLRAPDVRVPLDWGAERYGMAWRLVCTDPVDTVRRLLAWDGEQNSGLHDLSVTSGGLEHAYLALLARQAGRNDIAPERSMA